MHNWRENHVGIQLQVSKYKKLVNLELDTNVILRRLRDK